MQALRTRAAGVARRARPTALRTSRSYASESHGHHEAPKVNEGLGTAFYVFAGALPVSIVAYQISRPGANGEPSSLSNWLQQFDYLQKDYEVRNKIRTDIIEQAAHDKHLFMNASQSRHVELKTPELFNSGSPWCVPAGHSVNLDQITEHYRKQAVAEEERVAKKLAEKAAEPPVEKPNLSQLYQ
ncbi:hypothetical protein F5Y08DRAFT_292974 [Xylaria arbuscula]|nr:hypothetical protein F5Y08DRAFT_292974 [Xylaria arbuscula]